MIQFLTVKEIAKNLKINPITIYEYIKNGKLSAIRLGRYYRVDKRDFEHFIEAQKVTITHL